MRRWLKSFAIFAGYIGMLKGFFQVDVTQGLALWATLYLALSSLTYPLIDVPSSSCGVCSIQSTLSLYLASPWYWWVQRRRQRAN